VYDSVNSFNGVTWEIFKKYNVFNACETLG